MRRHFRVSQRHFLRLCAIHTTHILIMCACLKKATPDRETIQNPYRSRRTITVCLCLPWIRFSAHMWAETSWWLCHCRRWCLRCIRLRVVGCLFSIRATALENGMQFTLIISKFHGELWQMAEVLKLSVSFASLTAHDVWRDAITLFESSAFRTVWEPFFFRVCTQSE